MHLPTTYVVIHLNGLRVYAVYTEYERLHKGMIKEVPIEFIDIEGQLNVVSGKYVDLIWISTPESRAMGRAHDEMVEAEVPKKQDWEQD